MFLNDVHKKEEIQAIAISDLKTLGIKYRAKKSRQHVEEAKSRKVFKRSLNVLPVETVTLPSGQQLVVPKIVHELCSFIVTKIDTEGLFRKGGSKNRQNEIKLSLDAGCRLGDDHHQIDVASVLKTFFRELTEPLIPYSFHELFLRCMLSMDRKQQADATLLACLLLPTVHLNTLTYFMQFLQRVADYQEFNKMNAYNLAVVIGPTLFPAEEKIPNNATLRMTNTCELFKLLIENATKIGLLNDSIIERIAQASTSTRSGADDVETQSVKKKKKRRSGSLTRMLSGLKKIVTHKSEDAIQAAAPPDLLMTPCLTRSAKKRKLEGAGMSAKKRHGIVGNLPQNVLLNTPFTPVNNNPTGKKKITPEKESKIATHKTDTAKEKRMLWSNNKTKNKKSDSSSTSSIQRRWSAVSSAAGFKKKKIRNASVGIESTILKPDPRIDNEINDLHEEMTAQSEPDYVRIPKAEYEEIKNRVSAIERRISIELETAPLPDPSMPDANTDAVDEVTKKYEETLVHAEPLSPTTDQLAKRLSRELKIRRSSDQTRPVFRSPSARKIGSLRRKEGQKVRLSRTHTWCVTPRASIRRSSAVSKPPTTDLSESTSTNEPPKVASSPQRTKSTNSSVLSTASSIVTDSSGASWKSAQGFFSTPDVPHPSFDSNCRASLARLRSQNAGMVMAKARLFDNMGEYSAEGESESVAVTANSARPPGPPPKIGASRTQINRIRTLRMEERRKKSMSPRKRPCRSPGIHRLPPKGALRLAQDVLVLKEANREMDGTTPRSNMPVIKRSLNAKSPRRLCKTPMSMMSMEGNSRQTPMKGTRLIMD